MLAEAAGVNRTVAVHPPPLGTSPTQVVSTSVNAPWFAPPSGDVVDVQRGRAVVGESEDLRCADLVDDLVDERELLRIEARRRVAPACANPTNASDPSSGSRTATAFTGVGTRPSDDDAAPAGAGRR